MADIHVPLTFNGNDLNTIPGLQITMTAPYQPPTRELTVFSIASADRSATTSAYFVRKDIPCQMVIRRNSKALMEQSLDTLMGMLRATNADLLIGQSGGVRRYVSATADAISTNGNTGGYIEIDLKFVCSEPLGTDNFITSLLTQLNVTAATITYPITIDGNTSQRPRFVITVDSVTDGISKTITITNPVNDQAISVTASWEAADILIIDTDTGEVTINDDPAEFTGALPEWEPGASYVNYSDNFSARQVDIIATYRKRYL